MPKNGEKKVVQKLMSERLRKVRYELRTLLRLEYQKKYRNFDERLIVVGQDKSLSYDEYREKHGLILRKKEELDSAYFRYPLCCGFCGDRTENLVYNPVKYRWRCVLCYEEAHKKFPKEYP